MVMVHINHVPGGRAILPSASSQFPPLFLSCVQDFETRVFTPYFFPTMDQVFELFQANPGPELVLVVKREHALQAGYVHVDWDLVGVTLPPHVSCTCM